MVLLDFSKKEVKISLSIQKLVSKLVLHLIEFMGSTGDSDRAENHIRNQNTSKYLKFCQALLSQESFIEQDQDFEEFLYYFLKCSTMFTDDQVRFELRQDIYAAAKDMDMRALDRFLKYGIDDKDWVEFMDSLSYSITGDEIDEFNCSSQMIFRKMMMNEVNKQGNAIVALCHSMKI